MDVIKFVVCGAGQRGELLTEQVLSKLEGVKVSAVSDPYTDKAEKLCTKLSENGFDRPNVYSDYKEMFTKEKPDAVFIATSWSAHVEIALCAMEAGIAVAMEVGGAYNEEECRELIATYERTKTPFMFMENCCFNKDELLATALVRKGVFGKPVYCHGAYSHDLREEIGYGNIRRLYRLHEYTTRNRDNYPTHDLGPIAKILGINRGNRMVSLSSRASGSFGLSEYVNNNPELSEIHGREFKQGDVVETLITCENGELISLKLNTTLPTFYSREFTVQGTRGMYKAETNTVVVDDMEDFSHDKSLLANGNLINNAKNYEEYLPEMWKKVTPEIIEAGHGGCDVFEFEAFCEALREGREMPIDVYDAAAWMSISYLSEKSIALGGAPVEIPDFTSGAYKTRPMCDVVEI